MSRISKESIPFFRASITDAEIREVVECLRSGWLTTGPRTRQFETAFADFVGAKHAVAVNSCTAALHLAVESLGLRQGQAVLVPTMTFAATAEVVRYQGAIPILVDCDRKTLNIDLDSVSAALRNVRAGRTPLDPAIEIVGIIPVHVGGLMLDMDAVKAFAEANGLWVVEDAAHALPAAFRSTSTGNWRRCGEGTASVTCYSFYANKTITTGEGGMAVTDNESLANRIRQMALHGLSAAAWNRFSGGSWDYQIVAPGYKYNLTDIAAAIGIHQLKRAEALRQRREEHALRYLERLGQVAEIELPQVSEDRLHSWHLFPIRLRSQHLTIERDAFIRELKADAVSTAVHWRPLHLHAYYQENFGWQSDCCPAAGIVWKQLVSLPLSPSHTDIEIDTVIQSVKRVCRTWGRVKSANPKAA